MDHTDMFEGERPRLVGIASRVLGDHAEAQDIVQQAWLRLNATDVEIVSLPAWLTTVTTRLCLDRLRSRTPTPVGDVELTPTANDPADEVALAETVGLALQVVLDRLSPNERVALVLHDSFGFEFPTIAAILDTTPTASASSTSSAGSGAVPASSISAVGMGVCRRSRSRHSRTVTVVSHAGRLSISVSVP